MEELQDILESIDVSNDIDAVFFIRPQCQCNEVSNSCQKQLPFIDNYFFIWMKSECVVRASLV
jgi:hypothetical protein